MISNNLSGYQAAAAQVLAINSDIAWLTALRSQAFTAFSTQGFPTHKTEAWRYVRLNMLREQSFEPMEKSLITAEQVQPWLLADCYHVVVVNGFWDEALSFLPQKGVQCQTLSTVLSTQPDRVRPYFENTDFNDSLLALNSALCQQGLFLQVLDDCVIDKPIQLLFVYDEASAQKTSQQRHIIQIGASASVEWIEQTISLNKDVCFANVVWHMDVAEYAKCTWQQLIHHQAIHFGHYLVSQQQHSVFDGLSFLLSGHIIRTHFDQVFCGEYARCRVRGLTTTHGNEQMDQHLTIRHAVPHCQSEQNFKGLADGHSRLIFNGKVVVEKHAQKTDAVQQHQNLLLSQTAEIYTKPELEIYANDVKCAHGATVGQLSDEALFYLQARGIPAVEARRLLMLAFAKELMAAIPCAALKAVVNDLFIG